MTKIEEHWKLIERKDYTKVMQSGMLEIVNNSYNQIIKELITNPNSKLSQDIKETLTPHTNGGHDINDIKYNLIKNFKIYEDESDQTYKVIIDWGKIKANLLWNKPELEEL